MGTVLITGASSGIGLATSVEPAKRDWSVVATMPDREPRDELDRQLLSAGVSGHVSVDRLDVTDSQAIDRVVAGLDLSNRRLDAVVHCAGIAAGGAFEDLDDTLIRHVMEVNFFGVLALTRRLLPAFRAQRYGRIVIISSEAAFAGQPVISPYCASKWAIEGWVEALCYELEPFNIQIILIEPGAHRTNIWTRSPMIIPDESVYRPLLRHLQGAVEEHLEKIAGDPADVAKVVATALEAKHPRFRYTVGRTAKILHFMRGKVPTSIVRKVVGRHFGLRQVNWHQGSAAITLGRRPFFARKRSRVRARLRDEV
jgi:NAD(P)-dependent dehydrogenase (short-subunit alcohol dehydrogenase family)